MQEKWKTKEFENYIHIWLGEKLKKATKEMARSHHRPRWANTRQGGHNADDNEMDIYGNVLCSGI
jgi:hypothetical protein